MLRDDQSSGLAKLKEIVMELHRSASALDGLIQEIETTDADVNNEDYTNHYIKMQYRIRSNVLESRFGDLTKREYLAWKSMNI